MPKYIFVTLLILTGYAASRAEEFSSGPDRVALIELFTSEGCSSCPPADRVMNDLADDKGLWKKFVPVAFHVDYWNYLGWTDPYSSADFSARQRRYTKEWSARSTYTPCFVVNGAVSRTPDTHQSKDRPGVLKVVFRDGEALVTFSAEKSTDDFIAWVVPLSGKESQSVTAGENRGRELEHSFVALGLASAAMTPTNNIYSATFKLPADARPKALAVWVSHRKSIAPLQATGGWFKTLPKNQPR